MNRNVVVLLVTAFSLTLSGCDSLPGWMGGKKTEKQKLAGERITILPVDSGLKTDASLKDTSLALPNVSHNTEWAQHNGGFASANSNLAGGTFDKVTHSEIGDGNGFKSILVPLPVVGGGMVFAMDQLGYISAHEASNIKKVKWVSKAIVEEDEPPIIGGGLAYDHDRLYVVSGRGVIAALDTTTGKALWTKNLHVPLRSAPKVADGKIYTTSIDNQTYAISAVNGDIIWNHRGISEAAGLMNSVSPTVSGENVVIPYSSGEIYVLSTADGKELWNDSLSPGKRSQASSLFAGIGSDPIVDDNVVLTVSSGGVIAVKSLANGQPAWEQPIGSINSPWVSGDNVFVLSSDNTLVALVKYDGRVRWATKLASFANAEEKRDPITWKGPVLVDNKLALVASNGQLLLVSAADGKISATKSIPEDIYTAPVVAGGTMYLVGQDATLYAFQ